MQLQNIGYDDGKQLV